MFENIIKFFKNLGKKEKDKESSDTAKERLHLVLMQDRANVSADFLELMRQEIIEVIKKYIDVDEKAIDVRLTNKTNEDGTVGAPALYANIPIVTIKNEARMANVPQNKQNEAKKEEEKTEKIVESELKESKVENTEKNQTDINENSQEEKETDSSPETKIENKDDEKIDEPEKILEEAKKIQNEVEKEQQKEEVEQKKEGEQKNIETVKAENEEQKEQSKDENIHV